MELNYAELTVVLSLVNKELENDNRGFYEGLLKDLKDKIEHEFVKRLNKK